MSFRRRWVWGSQIFLAAVLAFYIWRSLSSQWDDFRNLEWSLAPNAGPIAGSVVLVMITYALLVLAWRTVIGGWGQALGYRTAIGIWTVSNLGRYLPGKIWSIAGLAVLAHRAGVARWAAVGAAVMVQALVIGTGAAVAAVTVPAALTRLQMSMAFLIAVVIVGALMSKRLISFIRSLRNFEDGLRPLSLPTAVIGSGITALSWVGYGLAFWALAHGLVPEVNLSLRQATGVFVVGYVSGLLALFAPGGIGVREAVYVAMLTPAVGGGNALLLAVGSRLLFTVTELLAAAAGAVIGKVLPGDVDREPDSLNEDAETTSR